jgi:RNA polymerase sigma-70 factor (ECF subfamily)
MKEIACSHVFEYNGHNMAGEQSSENMSGHEERFLAAYDEYNDALFRHACMRISDREKAIDLVHDTYTKVWSYVRKGYEVEQFRPFLYKVLNNLIIDTYRKKKEASLDSLMEIDGVDEGSFDELSESTVEALAATIDGRKAFELMDELPDVYKEVLILRFVDGLGPKEMSALTEEKENVISVRIHRGLKLLRKKIEAQDEFADEKRKATARKKAADKKTN